MPDIETAKALLSAADRDLRALCNMIDADRFPFAEVAEIVTGNTPPEKDSYNYGRSNRSSLAQRLIPGSGTTIVG